MRPLVGSLELEETENLFSYGTLQTDPVQFAIFGRRLKGKPDTLLGYSVTMTATDDQDFVKKTGATHHRNLQFTGSASDFVEGTVFTITPGELEPADAYEPADYKRVRVELKSGVEAWVYINARR